MCGRYTLSRTSELFERFQAEAADLGLGPHYNITPEETLPVVVREDRNRIEMMRWGLIPSWAKEPKSIAINARVEGILTKPSFRKPIRSQRCLVPATGFYEWKKAPTGKTPYYIRRKDGELFAFAGIYDHWQSREAGEVKTFAILTTEPNQLLREIHNRMPVILPREQESLWLTADAAMTPSLLESLQTLPEEQLEFYPVSRRVNRAGNDSPDLISKVVQDEVA